MSSAPGEAFEERTILLGVTGGIAAYKTATLASRWTQRGARVRVLMTAAATRFVTPLTFQSLTRQPVSTDIWRAEEEGHYRPEHIDAGTQGDLFSSLPRPPIFLPTPPTGSRTTSSPSQYLPTRAPSSSLRP